MLIKQESITSQKLGSRDFWRIANSVLSKGKSAIPPLFNSLDVLPSVSDKANLFAENFFKNANLDDSGTCLHVFPSRTNFKLHNISVTSKMVKKVKMNLDLSKASGPDCFPDCWKVSSVIPGFKACVCYFLSNFYFFTK